MSTTAQKKSIKDFKGICGATDKVAADLLKRYNYNVEQALDHFYTHGGSTSPTADYSGSYGSKKADKSKLTKIFDKYADNKDKDTMQAEPLGQFFRDAGVDPEKEGAVTLGAAYKLKCKVLGVIKRSEFVDGYTPLGLDSMDKIKADMNNVREMLKNKVQFRDFYRWLFDFIKEEPDRKSVDLEPALDFLKCVLPPHFPLLDQFVEFLKEQKTKTVSCDVWTQAFEFGRDIKADLSNYEVDGAWPVLFDDFVAYVNDQKAKKATATLTKTDSSKDNKGKDANAKTAAKK